MSQNNREETHNVSNSPTLNFQFDYFLRREMIHQHPQCLAT